MPPLSPFRFERTLDEWQRRVLALIDERQSVVVCAPTSAGKTVLSTYVTLHTSKIMFVVPTEPLVWQVAAMLYNVLGSDVSFVTNTFVYNPLRQNSQEWQCIVGTPLALESALVKPRGRPGQEHVGKQDCMCLRACLHEIQYAVYDEVHTLDNEEGAALERLIKAVRCNFLALSATIGNADTIRAWWERVHRMHVHDEYEELCQDLEFSRLQVKHSDCIE